MKFIDKLKSIFSKKPKEDEKWPNPLPQMHYLVAYQYSSDEGGGNGSSIMSITSPKFDRNIKSENLERARKEILAEVEGIKGRNVDQVIILSISFLAYCTDKEFFE